MGWQNEVNVENCILATAQYGGPIAVRRNDKKVVKVQGSAQPIVSIYSSSGQQISHIRVWKNVQIENVSFNCSFVVEAKSDSADGLV